MESSAEKLEAGVMMMNAVDQFPFMGHVLVVLVITYLFLSFTSNGFFYFCFFVVYLFEVPRMQTACIIVLHICPRLLLISLP